MLMDRLFWSNTPVLMSVRPDEPDIRSLRMEIQDKLTECEIAPAKYLKFLNHKTDYRKSEYIKFLNLDAEELITNLTPENVDEIDIPKIKKTIDYHLNAIKKYESKIPDAPVRVGIYSVNIQGIRSVLIKKHMGIVQSATELLGKCCKGVGKDITKKYEEIRRRLQQVPVNVEDVASMNEYIEGIGAVLAQLGPKLAVVTEANRVLDSYNIKDAEQFGMFWKLQGWPKKIYAQVDATEQTQSEKKMEYAAEMEDEQVVFEQTLIALDQECSQFQGYTDIGRVSMVAQHVKSLDEKIKKAEDDSRTFNQREILFGREPTEYSKVGDIRKRFTPYQGLWSNVSSWLTAHEGWMTGPFDEIDGVGLEDVVDRFNKGVTKAYKQFEKQGNTACMDIASQVRSQIADFVPHVPWIMAIRNQGMRERHWIELSEKVGTELNPENGDFTIQGAFDMELFKHTELLQKLEIKPGKKIRLKSSWMKWQPNGRKLIWIFHHIARQAPVPCVAWMS